RLPIGAEIIRGQGVHFRVWAHKSARVDVILDLAGEKRLVSPLHAEGNGYFSALINNVPAGALYRFQCDGATTWLPDPASRFQPQGPHGPSQVIDPAAFSWTDQEWRGMPREPRVLYELHVGTFTTEGT